MVASIALSLDRKCRRQCSPFLCTMVANVWLKTHHTNWFRSEQRVTRVVTCWK
ncbi:hypothetical protein HanIR_Chr11g0555951 [Helianthus annuus]|nr:hypothetical protein HanIR_Chr11g0555951 [Helianthus annuus]